MFGANVAAKTITLDARRDLKLAYGRSLAI